MKRAAEAAAIAHTHLQLISFLPSSRNDWWRRTKECHDSQHQCSVAWRPLSFLMVLFSLSSQKGGGGGGLLASLHFFTSKSNHFFFQRFAHYTFRGGCSQKNIFQHKKTLLFSVVRKSSSFLHPPAGDLNSTKDEDLFEQYLILLK